MRRFFCMLFALIFFAAPMLHASAERGEPVLGKDAVYRPLLPLSGYKIGIDPGHQRHANSERETIAPYSSEKKAKVSSGTKGVSTGIYEYETNLTVSLLLAELLTELGAEVKLTRDTHDVDISNQERAIMMNEWEADIVLRIHCNGSDDQTVHGMGMYVRYSGDDAEECYRLGECLLDAMCAETGAKKQRVYRRDTYTGLNYSAVPSVLVEMGYMSNPDEDEKLNDPEYQEKLVLGAVKGIMDYFSITQ